MNSTLNKALASLRAREQRGERGFTLIELMVVIIIIGVLAAIAIPIFLNQRQSAWDAETKVDLSNFVLAAASFNADNKGVFGTTTNPMTTTALTSAPYNFTPSVDDPMTDWTLNVAADKKTYTVTVFNKNFVPSTGHVFTFTSSTGLTSVS